MSPSSSPTLPSTTKWSEEPARQPSCRRDRPLRRPSSASTALTRVRAATTAGSSGPCPSAGDGGAFVTSTPGQTLRAACRFQERRTLFQAGKAQISTCGAPALRPRARGRDRSLPADESKGCRVERHRCALALQLFERDGQSVAGESAEVEQHTGLVALCRGVVARRYVEDGTGREFDDRAVLHTDGHPPR